MHREDCSCADGNDPEPCVIEGCSNMGVHYFGPITLPVGEGEYVPVEYEEGVDYPCDEDGCTAENLCIPCRIRENGTVEWSGETEDFSYWECQACFDGDDDHLDPDE